MFTTPHITSYLLPHKPQAPACFKQALTMFLIWVMLQMTVPSRHIL